MTFSYILGTPGKVAPEPGSAWRLPAPASAVNCCSPLMEPPLTRLVPPGALEEVGMFDNTSGDHRYFSSTNALPFPESDRAKNDAHNEERRFKSALKRRAISLAVNARRTAHDVAAPDATSTTIGGAL